MKKNKNEEKKQNQNQKNNNKKKGNQNNDEDNKEQKLKSVQHVKARHILCGKLSKIQEAYNKLFEQFQNKPSAAEFGKIAQEFSECSSARKGGDLGWFSRGKMVPQFQEVAFNTPSNQMSEIFKTEHGYHFLFVEDRKN